MFDNVNNNCAFGEQIAAVLYGELEAENKPAFDAHLQTCARCADELKSFAAVRAAVADWRALEFDSLHTPKFEIEFAPRFSTQNIHAILPQNESRLDRLRKFFAFSPTFAVAASLLFIAICAGLIAYNFAGGNQIAGLENQSNSAQENKAATTKDTNKIPTSGSETIEREKEFAAQVSPEPTATAGKNNPSHDAREPVAPSRIIKISNVASKQSFAARKVYNSTANRRSFNSNSTVAVNDSNVKTRRAPKLSSIEEEDEDATLRLTDLLDDGSGK